MNGKFLIRGYAPFISPRAFSKCTSKVTRLANSPMVKPIISPFAYRTPPSRPSCSKAAKARIIASCS